MTQTQHPHDSVAAEYQRAIANAKAHMNCWDTNSPEEHHYWITLHSQLVTDYNRLYNVNLGRDA
jgi:hypothetical protein